MDVENANCKVRVSQCTDMEILPIERPLKVDQEIAGLEKLVEELHRVFSSSHVNVQDVQKLMAGYKSDPKDWKKFAKYDRFRYTRNLVDAGNGLFNIMILCWGPGHASAIHDHADSHCFMKILSGNLEEIRYDWPDHVQPEVLKVINQKSKTDHTCDGQTFEDTATDTQTDSPSDTCRIDKSSDSCQSDSCDYEDDGYCLRDMKDMKEIGRTRLEVNDVCYINDALGLHRMENPSHVHGAVSLHLYCPPFDSCRVFDARTGRPTEVKVTFWSMYGKKIQRVIEGNQIADSQQ